MPHGDKSSYTDKQKRQASHIEAGYKKKGVSKKTAKARAWSTVNKLSGGGKKKPAVRRRRPARTAVRVQELAEPLSADGR